MTPSLEPIQMLWVSGDLSRMELLSIRSFLANGHPVHLYSYAPPANVPRHVSVFDARTIVPEDLAPAGPAAPFAPGSLGAFSDFFRYQLLLQRGGWWVDTDVVCLRPWQFAQPALTASTQEHGHGPVANGFAMRFPAGHPVIAACAAALRDCRLTELAIDRTGPLLLNRVLADLGQTGLMLPSEVFAPVPWNASARLVQSCFARWGWAALKQRIRRPHLNSRFTPRTVGLHLWHEMWRHAGRDKRAHYPRSSWYERLQRRYNPAVP